MGGMGGVSGFQLSEKDLEYRLFRFFDFTVEPGKHYRYRVSLLLWNPNWKVPPQYLARADLAKKWYVETEFSDPSDLFSIAHAVKHREARIYLYYQAVCAAMADNKLVDGELDALLQLADVFEFETDVARRFIRWVQDSLELRDRGQQLLVEM